jgi:putative aldouronate transport system permease protein
MAIDRIKKKSIQDKIFDNINYIFLLLFTLVTVYPFYNSIISSFNEGQDTLKGSLFSLPRVFTLENYASVLSNPEFLNAAVITVSRTVVGTIISLFFTAAFGYIISKPNLCFRKFYIIFGIITMYFNGGLIPNYLLIRNIGLIDNFLVYIFPLAFSMINALIFMSFFKALPASLEESGKLDGANDLIIFVKIIIPISGPVFASLGLFNAVVQWNSWFDTMLYTSKPYLETLSHMFQRMLLAQQYVEKNAQILSNSITTTSMSLNLAAMVVTVTPILLIYPFLQKYFAKGIMLGSVKG